jgi:glycosyltransferase involved in cell wall biosynthesis
MRILLLSAYDAASHRRWREGLVAAFPEYDWTVLTLPPRYFSWRIRGNSLSWAMGQRELLSQPYDLLVATSMTDLSALKGLLPSLALTPSIVYFHENQFAYPKSDQQFQTVEPQILNIYTALAADQLLFNSDFNRQTFLDGANTLLSKMPDQLPAGIVESLAAKSTCLPVPMEANCYQTATHKNDCLEIIWNHRWEYDKAPERLWRAIEQLLAKTRNFRLHVVGERFRQFPAVFQDMHALLQRCYPGVLGQWGYVQDRSAYQQLLVQADVVLSTALHDFQGLSVIEGACHGCLPLVPDRLCYGEWFATAFRYDSFVNDSDAEAAALTVQLADWIAAFELGKLPAAPDLSQLSWATLKPRYGDIFTTVAAGSPA